MPECKSQILKLLPAYFYTYTSTWPLPTSPTHICLGTSHHRDQNTYHRVMFLFEKIITAFGIQRNTNTSHALDLIQHCIKSHHSPKLDNISGNEKTNLSADPFKRSSVLDIHPDTSHCTLPNHPPTPLYPPHGRTSPHPYLLVHTAKALAKNSPTGKLVLLCWWDCPETSTGSSHLFRSLTYSLHADRMMYNISKLSSAACKTNWNHNFIRNPCRCNTKSVSLSNKLAETVCAARFQPKYQNIWQNHPNIRIFDKICQIFAEIVKYSKYLTKSAKWTIWTSRGPIWTSRGAIWTSRGAIWTSRVAIWTSRGAIWTIRFVQNCRFVVHLADFVKYLKYLTISANIWQILSNI